MAKKTPKRFYEFPRWQEAMAMVERIGSGFRQCVDQNVRRGQEGYSWKERVIEKWLVGPNARTVAVLLVEGYVMTHGDIDVLVYMELPQPTFTGMEDAIKADIERRRPDAIVA